jgi:hypothetical protein
MVEKSEPFNSSLSITTYACLHSHLLSSSGFCIPILTPITHIQSLLCRKAVSASL